MSDTNHSLDPIIEGWAFDPTAPTARKSEGDDGRPVLLLRVDLGVLQLETTGRPDGSRPYDKASMLEWILHREQNVDAEFALSTEECFDVDREFSQFYHRRIAWIALREYANAAADAKHTLSLMDACLRHAPDEEWAISHEQHRPFVLFHQAQAHALQRVEEQGEPSAAIEELNRGIESIRAFYEEHELEQDFDEDELVHRLVHARESLREKYDLGKTLPEQLADAIANEQFELAARLRDRIRDQQR